jgi:glycerol-3-phosphate acyltransferase PlsY
LSTAALAVVGVLLCGYLLGSISAAIVACRALGRADPRSSGSRNPGATNVLRVAGRDAALLTLVGDMLKGMVAVVVARALGMDPLVWALAGAGAFIGHIYPVFFAFQGGKGVATALGALLAATPGAGVLTAATWLGVFGVTRVSALGALSAFALAPVFVAVLTGAPARVGVTLAVSALLFWRHRSNIRALMAGKPG